MKGYGRWFWIKVAFFTAFFYAIVMLAWTTKIVW